VGRQRLGVVILIPQPLATEVEGLRRALGDGSRPRIAPHCTLVSPVNVPDRDLPAALAVLREAAAATPPLTLAVGPASSFHPVTPVAYLQVSAREDAAALTELRARLDVAPLARQTDHPYEPHVTICDDISEERAGATISALSDFRVDVAVDRIHLMGVGPSGAWRAIADAPLGGDGGEVGRGSLPLELRTTGRPDPEAGALLAVEAEPAGTPFAITARRDGAVVGAIWGWTAGARLEVADLVVAAAHRNQGIGRHLLAALEDLARRRNASVLGTSSAAGGVPGALLAGAGWGAVGEPDPDGRRRWERRLGPAG
jgi:2'-5' RNA ligase/GNAT superfamily N-acetyltransferase